MSHDVDLSRATPRYPALAHRRGLFWVLLLAYLLVLTALIAMSITQHSRSTEGARRSVAQAFLPVFGEA